MEELFVLVPSTRERRRRLCGRRLFPPPPPPLSDHRHLFRRCGRRHRRFLSTLLSTRCAARRRRADHREGRRDDQAAPGRLQGEDEPVEGVHLGDAPLCFIYLCAISLVKLFPPGRHLLRHLGSRSSRHALSAVGRAGCREWRTPADDPRRTARGDAAYHCSPLEPLLRAFGQLAHYACHVSGCAREAAGGAAAGKCAGDNLRQRRQRRRWWTRNGRQRRELAEQQLWRAAAGADATDGAAADGGADGGGGGTAANGVRPGDDGQAHPECTLAGRAGWWERRQRRPGCPAGGWVGGVRSVCVSGCLGVCSNKVRVVAWESNLGQENGMLESEVTESDSEVGAIDWHILVSCVVSASNTSIQWPTH